MTVLISTENYIRRDKPSVLVTSPGSPDLHSVRNYSTNLRYPNRLTPAATATQQENSVGGRVQLKLGFDPSSLQLIVTILGAKDLVPRVNGAARNPYAKVSSEYNVNESSNRNASFPDLLASRSKWKIQKTNENASSYQRASLGSNIRIRRPP